MSRIIKGASLLAVLMALLGLVMSALGTTNAQAIPSQAIVNTAVVPLDNMSAPADVMTPEALTAPSQVVVPSLVPMQVPSDITVTKTGKDIKKTSNKYKYRLEISKSKPKFYDLGTIKRTSIAGGSTNVFKVKIEKTNNYRLRVTLSETWFAESIHDSSAGRYRSRVWADAVRLNGEWRELEWNDPKLVYPSVPGKAFYVQGRFRYDQSWWDYVNQEWVITDEGVDTTKRIYFISVKTKK